jgi:hypothetical protein
VLDETRWVTQVFYGRLEAVLGWKSIVGYGVDRIFGAGM